jgi:mono/diheme cytochrome c family protein
MRIALPLTALLLLGCRGGEAGESGPATAETSPPSGAPTHPAEIQAAIEQGRELFFGRALCSTCHKVGDQGTMIVGPNLGVGDGMEQPFASRVGTRGENIDPPIYVIDSILDPNAITVPTYARSVMKSPDDIPIALTDDELVSLAAFILSVGAEQPLSQAELDRARARIPGARAARQERAPGK